MTAATHQGILSWVKRLHQIKLGGGARTSNRDLAYILTNLATLLDNGVSLPKALHTLSEEGSLRRYAEMLRRICVRVEAGDAFSASLTEFPDTFSELVVAQVKVGERSGTVPATLDRIASQVERSNELRGKILKRLSYPLILTVAGTGVVIFLLTFVVPQFEQTYRQARIPLPFCTRFLMTASGVALHYGWLVVAGGIGGLLLLKHLRRNPAFALSMDALLLRLPVAGPWLRDMAVLQFMSALAVMMEAGFKLIDALDSSLGAIGNRAVHGAVLDLRSAVRRGDRLSQELDRHRKLFPPIVSQLVIVGEQTGNLSKASGHVSNHLRRQIERRADLAVAMLEPFITISMALVIGLILLAIYLPMFGMIDAVDSMGGP